MDNPLTKIRNFFRGGLLKKGERSILGVDISSSTIKIVQIRKELGRAVLETYGEIYLGPYGGMAAGQAVALPLEKVAEALADLIKGSNATAKRAVMSIPLRSSLIILMELPALDEKKVNDMIPIEARKYIPVPMSEISLDWWVIPKRERVEQRADESAGDAQRVPRVEVLMVAIYNQMVADYQKISSLVGIDTKTFEIETFSAIRSLFGHDLSPTMIIDFGASTTKVAIADYGSVRVSHIIQKGAQDITLALSHSLGVPFEKAEEIKRESGIMGQTGPRNISGVASPVIEYIFFEAGSVMAQYQRKYARSIAKTILIGGGSLLGGLPEVAARSFEVEVVYGNPFMKLEAPAYFEDRLKTIGPEFAVAVGLALRGLQEME